MRAQGGKQVERGLGKSGVPIRCQAEMGEAGGPSLGHVSPIRPQAWPHLDSKFIQGGHKLNSDTPTKAESRRQQDTLIKALVLWGFGLGELWFPRLPEVKGQLVK